MTALATLRMRYGPCQSPVALLQHGPPTRLWVLSWTPAGTGGAPIIFGSRVRPTVGTRHDERNLFLRHDKQMSVCVTTNRFLLHHDTSSQDQQRLRSSMHLTGNLVRRACRFLGCNTTAVSTTRTDKHKKGGKRTGRRKLSDLRIMKPGALGKQETERAIAVGRSEYTALS